MTDLPGPDAILAILENANGALPRRALFAALDVSKEAQHALKKTLKKMAQKGEIILLPGHRIGVPQRTPVTLQLMVQGLDADGNLHIRSVERDADGDLLVFTLPADSKGAEKLGIGDRFLARVTPTARAPKVQILKKLDAAEGQLLGIIEQGRDGLRLKPLNRKDGAPLPLLVPPDMRTVIGAVASAIKVEQGRIFVAELRDVLGMPDNPKLISHMSAYEAGLMDEFPPQVKKEAEAFTLPAADEKREDLTALPLVTIDGPDARDHDDAVFAEDDPDRPGYMHIIVAIADVAYYVRTGTALDNEARRRGNSTYFPDKVIPMLPETLSNDLCSLKPHVPRACMVAHLHIDGEGKLQTYKFTRGLMRSAARLTYEQVQAAHDGHPDETMTPLMDNVVAPLYKAYRILAAARERRNALNIETIERQVVIDERGEMTGVRPRSRYDSHKLIEEMMILANVAAASALEDKRTPCVYRVHDKPSADRLATLSDFMKGIGHSVPSNLSLDGRQINALLGSVKDDTLKPLVSTLVLRTQAQARYDTENAGHFGLQLEKYGHFTSPIRRYADLLVHRGLISAYGLGQGGFKNEEEKAELPELAEHITQTERISSEAERQAIDRFTARFLSDKVGAEFEGIISSVTRFGLFINLADTGADGLLPMRWLPDDYYIHDERKQTLTGRRSGVVFRFGDKVTVRLAEINALAGMLSFELAGSVKRARRDDDRHGDRGGFRRSKPPVRGKHQDRDDRHRGDDGGSQHRGGHKGKPSGSGKPRSDHGGNSGDNWQGGDKKNLPGRGNSHIKKGTYKGRRGPK
jgi:ribonuclease R